MLTIEMVIFAAVLIGVLAGMFLEKFRVRTELAEQGSNALQLAGPGGAGTALVPGHRAPAAMTGTAQLRVVTDARFTSQRLLAENIQRVLEALEIIIAELGQDWRVMPQVHLTEFIGSPDKASEAAVRDHRIDLLIVSAQQMPVAAVEYQALGQIHDDAAINDAVKREALRRADVPYIEVRTADTPDMLREQLRRLVAIQAVTGAPASPRPAARKPGGRPASDGNP